MSVVIRGGTVVTADRTYRADVRCEGETIVEVSEDLEVPSGAELVDAGGCFVMPGGIDPQTHMQLPFMGTAATDDFYSGTTAMMTGGTTSLIDFVIPAKGQRLMDAWRQWNEWAQKSTGDYGFHVAVTWWDEQVPNEMRELATQRGVNSFKHFMAYKGAIMADDEILVNSFKIVREVGAMATIHAENGELVAHLQNEIFEQGITGPEGHPLSRPPAVEAEATNRAIRIAEMIGVPVYIVHTSSRDAMEEVIRARTRGQTVFSEVLSQHLVIDSSVYRNPDWRTAAHHVMSPPFRDNTHQEFLWNALASGQAQTTATDHCSFLTEQKQMGKDDFRKIPNGTGGLEDRMSILWHHGVNQGRFGPERFVQVTSTNAAKLFNIYPKKGAIMPGADADVIVWDPSKSRTISAKTHHQNVDFNIFEGMQVQGVNVATVRRGAVTYLDGDVRVERGTGKFIHRPCGAPYVKALQKKLQKQAPTPVKR